MALTGRLGTRESMLGGIELGLVPSLLSRLPTRVMVEAQPQTSVSTGGGFPRTVPHIIPSCRTTAEVL